MSRSLPFWPQNWSRFGPLQGLERRKSAQRGSVLPLVALLIVAAGGLCVGLGRLGGDAVQAAQARTAADAAALAGAAEGEDLARDVADDNGAVLVAFVQDGLDVEVRARVGDAEAVARATRTAGGAAVPEVPGAS
ncbi:hypothetical protein BH23ACT1_BH23ACT1_03010 [soil metagenome]